PTLTPFTYASSRSTKAPKISMAWFPNCSLESQTAFLSQITPLLSPDTLGYGSCLFVSINGLEVHNPGTRMARHALHSKLARCQFSRSPLSPLSSAVFQDSVFSLSAFKILSTVPLCRYVFSRR